MKGELTPVEKKIFNAFFWLSMLLGNLAFWMWVIVETVKLGVK